MGGGPGGLSAALALGRAVKRVLLCDGGPRRNAEKIGRVRVCRLGRDRLEVEAGWIEAYRRLWDARFDALDQVVAALAREEERDER